MTENLETKSNSTDPDLVAGSTVLAVDTGHFLWAVFLSCLTFEILLVYLDLAVNWQRGSPFGPIRRLFNITREDALASWFSVTQTFMVGLVAWFIVAVVRKSGATRMRRVGWLILALFFTYMAVDDGAAIHERLGSTSERFSDSSAVGSAVKGFPSYAWQVLFVPFFGAMGLFVLYFLWREMPTTSERLRVLVALGLWTLAVAMDFVEGLEHGYAWFKQTFGWGSRVVRHFSKSIEEFLEMLGMTIFLVTFLGHLARISPRITIRFN